MRIASGAPSAERNVIASRIYHAPRCLKPRPNRQRSSSQRACGADEEMPVADGDYLWDVAFHAVDDTIVAEKYLADVFAAEFPDYAAGKWEFL